LFLSGICHSDESLTQKTAARIELLLCPLLSCGSEGFGIGLRNKFREFEDAG
jgi:hypothetical protein